MSRFFVSDEEQVIFDSTDPDKYFAYGPSVIRSKKGSLLISFDIGGNPEDLPDYRVLSYTKQKMVCRIIRRGVEPTEFNHVASFAICHARLFQVDQSIYLLGHNGRLQISKSADDGLTWSSLHEITESDGWHGSACNVVTSNGRLYLAMERRSDLSIRGWNVAGLSPHILSASLSSDLLDHRSWTISNSYSFNELFEHERFSYFGLPFMSTGYKFPVHSFINNKVVKSSPMGWLEGNIVKILDENHIWFDPHGRTLYLFLRTNTAGVGYAAVLKVVEVEEEGRHELYTELARAPSGEPLTFLLFPGGHAKFFILYDEPSERFWLCGNQPSDSMVKMQRMNRKRYNLPNNERNRLVLYHSKNAMDWIFSGAVSIGPCEQAARNYPAMYIDNKDLLIVSRAGDERAIDSQYSNQIRIHTVKDFRDLVY
jgi:hypothetical protein